MAIIIVGVHWMNFECFVGIWEGILVRLLWRSIVLQFGFADALPFVPTLACVFEGGVREVGAAQGHCLPSSYAIQNFVVYVILFRSLDPNVFLSHGIDLEMLHRELTLDGMELMLENFDICKPVATYIVLMENFGFSFGFSDKPQPKYGFDYTMEDYKESLECLLHVLALKNITLVAQGYFAPVVVNYAISHQESLNNLILINPPISDSIFNEQTLLIGFLWALKLTEQHAKLPSVLSSFTNFLLGEIFAQDPLRASDKLLTNCGPYLMDEEDAMVYRRPYLTSGSAGFALMSISRILKKELKQACDKISENEKYISKEQEGPFGGGACVEIYNKIGSGIKVHEFTKLYIA
eukprot:Gb_23201 [translate_table: standard]